MMQSRITAVREILAEKGIDAMMVLIEENRRYLSGFTGEDHQFDESAGALFISADQLILATDSRFELQAKIEAPQYDVIIYRHGLAKEITAIVARLGVRSLGFECMRVTVQQYQDYQKALADASCRVELISTEDIVERLRRVKSRPEIDQTQKALDLAEAVYKLVVKTLKPGMTEKQIAWAMERGLREAGADSLSFPVIVAAGPNSALPHAIPTDRPIAMGEPILFDWGAKLGGYCSDTSRTVLLGKPDERFLEIYHTVREAQKLAIEAVADGANSKAVDAVARGHIAAKGFGDKFGHGLGHGTGLAVHEGPRLSPLKESVLKTGMLVTVEPGIYLPDWGGVRIENQVVVGQDGPDVLNRLSTTYDISQI
jgi:Xaa-Pro aminopeptidase